MLTRAPVPQSLISLELAHTRCVFVETARHTFDADVGSFRHAVAIGLVVSLHTLQTVSAVACTNAISFKYSFCSAFTRASVFASSCVTSFCEIVLKNLNFQITIFNSKIFNLQF